MSADEILQAEAARAEVASLARRAGLEVDEQAVAGLAQNYRRTQAELRRLRAALDPADEPATTFDA